MFENLTSKIESAFSFFNKSTQLDEKQVDEGLRKIRQALLESDVALSVAKEFIANVKPKAIGQEVLKSITPGQLLVKIVYDELVKILGSEKSEINLNTVPPAKILVVGLQGSGKTTTSAKIAKFIEKNFNKKVMLSSLDVYRPAAQKQLELLGSQNNIQTIPIIEGQLPIEITQRTLAAASLSGSDVIIFDTAGRTQIDSVMMSELNNLKKIINPIETFLVADSLTGQDAVNIASEFKKTVDLTGIILTRIDGDGKGGAALSMKSVANCPIKFLGVGEKIDDFEIFHPERIANRILGMIPGISKIKKQIDEADIDESLLGKQEAVILSMTPKERDNPKIIDGSRKKRIANGSGTDIALVNKLLKQHKMMTGMMKRMSQGGGRNFGGLDGIPPELFNNLK